MVGIGLLIAAFRCIKEYMDGKVAVCKVKRVLPNGEIDSKKKAYCPDLKNEVEIFDTRH